MIAVFGSGFAHVNVLGNVEICIVVVRSTFITIQTSCRSVDCVLVHVAMQDFCCGGSLVNAVTFSGLGCSGKGLSHHPQKLFSFSFGNAYYSAFLCKIRVKQTYLLGILA